MYYFSTTFALLSSLSVKSFLCILFDQQSLNLGPVPSTLNILSKRTYFRYLPTYCIVNICFQAKSFKMSIKPSVPTNTTDVYIASFSHPVIRRFLFSTRIKDHAIYVHFSTFILLSTLTYYRAANMLLFTQKMALQMKFSFSMYKNATFTFQ